MSQGKRGIVWEDVKGGHIGRFGGERIYEITTVNLGTDFLPDKRIQLCYRNGVCTYCSTVHAAKMLVNSHFRLVKVDRE